MVRVAARDAPIKHLGSARAADIDIEETGGCIVVRSRLRCQRERLRDGFEATDFGLAEAAGPTRRERADDAGNETNSAGKRGNRRRAARRVEETEIFRVALVTEPREQWHVLPRPAFTEKEPFVPKPVQSESEIRTTPVVGIFHQLRREVRRGCAVVVRAPGDLLRNDLRVHRKNRASGPVDGNTACIEATAQAGKKFRHFATAKPALDQPVYDRRDERRSVRSRKHVLHRYPRQPPSCRRSYNWGVTEGEVPVVPVANVVALRTRPVQVLRDSSDRFSELITNQRTRV